MKNTGIHWSDDTVNPVAGCDGCELWPSASSVRLKILNALAGCKSSDAVGQRVGPALEDKPLSEIYACRIQIAKQITGTDTGEAYHAVIDAIRKAAVCYAGLISTMRAGHKGYPDAFEAPKLFPHRMAAAARWNLPRETDRKDKPWLAGFRRLIFVSDMGDALSKNVSFDYIRDEIIRNVASIEGKRHIWLWLTKRPARMAEFGAWLASQGIAWPDNLVAMTTVTSQGTTGRIDQLRKVPGKLKGLSVEPLFERVTLDLRGIDWVIVGGGSDTLAAQFHVEWALGLQDQCRKAGTAFFLKQLGKNPFFEGKPMKLKNKHGGDWGEWPVEWRTREVPPAFKATTA